MAIAAFGDYEEGTVPATPSTGHWRHYFKTDGMYYVDDAGTEIGPIGSAVAYGLIYAKDVSAAQGSISTTPTKVTGFTVDGPAQNTTPDHSNDQITIDVDGTYEVNFQVSFSGSVSTLFRYYLRLNGAEDNFACERQLGTGGDKGSASFIGVLALVDTDILTVYVEADGAAKSITVVQMQLMAHRVGA